MRRAIQLGKKRGQATFLGEGKGVLGAFIWFLQSGEEKGVRNRLAARGGLFLTLHFLCPHLGP
jgi:hypothetical protein